MTWLPHQGVPKSFLTQQKFTCPMFPSVRLLYDLENTQTHAVIDGALAYGMQIENYMLHYCSCFSLSCCADPLALSQGIK